MNVLHLVHHSLPYQDGYSLRTHRIAQELTGLGHQAVVATLPGIQMRMGGSGGGGSADAAAIDGIRYFHHHALPGRPAISGIATRLSRALLEVAPAGMVQCARDLYYGSTAGQPFAFLRWLGLAPSVAVDGYYCDLVARHQPLLIHAHTPFLNGRHAAALRKQYRLPYLYEVRGLWEDSYVSSEEWQDGDRSYQARRSAETQAMREADAVVAISSALRGEIVGRGVEADRVFVVPNGVDTAAFEPLPRDEELAGRYGLGDKVVIGYVSSLRELEGLDLLVSAMADVLREEGRAACLIVGDGPERRRLESLAGQLGIEDRVLFTGRVPHAEVKCYYSLLDVFVVPRIDLRVNHMVTPLKPFEAMAMEKAVLVSNVGGLTEIVQDGETGLVFQAGDREDLANKILHLARQMELRARLGRQARQWLVRERDWHTLVERYDEIYEDLVRPRREADQGK